MPNYSEFWGQGGVAYSLLVNRYPQRNRIRGVVNREGFRAFTALANSLIGASAGSGTGAITTRKVAPVASNAVDGGRRTIDTVSVINRTTTAADVAALKEMLFNVTRRPATYARDRSGNGGPTF